MSRINTEPNEYGENFRIAERFFLKTPRGFLFAVANDELLQKDFNATLCFQLQGQGKTVRIHDWQKDGEGLYPLEQLRLLKKRYPDTAGLILTGLDAALEQNPNLLLQLNFSREALSALGIPMLFWLGSNSLRRISFEAIDLYNQRASTSLYFEEESEPKESDQAVLHETGQNSENLRSLEARLTLLEQQLDEAEKNQRDPVDIANEIVLDLLQLHAAIPGKTQSIQLLIDRYSTEFDLEKPQTCDILAEAFLDLGNMEKARFLVEKALTRYRELARLTPQAYRTSVAKMLGKLANVQKRQHEFTEAEQGYRESLEIYRELATANPQTSLSNVAETLGNLANVETAQNKFPEAEIGYQESLNIYRQLAAANPESWLASVASTLNNLATLKTMQNENRAAEQGYREALKITGELATAVTWLHVSDFHLSDGAPYDQEVILRSLVASVKRFRQEGHEPDLIFATGDIAQQGKAKEYLHATRFFDDLLDAAGLGKDRLFIVPGNHDVDRTAGEFLARTLNSAESADRFFGSDKPFPHLTLKFQAFREWYNDYFQNIRSFPTNTTCSPVEAVAIRKSRVAVLPLNSALFCIGDDDHEKLFIGRRCLDKAKEQLQKLEVDLKIALMHHPLDWLSQVERSNIKSTLAQSVDLLLQGHYHETDTETIVSATGGYLKLAAGASYQTRAYPNSAIYATFYQNQVTIFPVRYEDSPREEWTLDTSVFPSPSYTGSFPLSSRVTSETAEAKDSTLEDNSYLDVQNTLREELGTINLLGTHALENIPVGLTDTFVSLRLSNTWRSDRQFTPGNLSCEMQKEEQTLSPEEVMRLVFEKKRLLLVIGDPGSGKTTLLKHYALSCLDGERYKVFGFTEPVLVFFLPLRELKTTGSSFASLASHLFAWSETHELEIPEQLFADWLKNRKTLLLLDGLDEISDPLQRIKACAWIDRIVSRFTKARIVVTSRATGYRKGEGIELSSLHTRADIMDFTAGQQAEFLTKWFMAACLGELKPSTISEEKWEKSLHQKANLKAESIIGFLGKEENRSIQTLARVPMLLQIMAILWKEREYLPGSRTELYEAALNYILDYRDRQKNINPLLKARDALRVLAPLSLWMQEVLKKDEVDRDAMQQQMQLKLNELNQRHTASAFCQNLVDRAGLLVEYRDKEYLFRHKSFREYLAGVQLNKDRDKPNRIKTLAEYFGNDWWEEPLRFFIEQVDAETFDRFLQELFDSPVSAEFTQKQQDLLETLIKEAPEKKLDALERKLLDPETTLNRQRYIMQCLKTIDKPEASDLLDRFIAAGLTKERPDIARGEDYIFIPGGQFIYSVTKKPETIKDFFMAKFTVTNQRYRQFITFLDSKEVASAQSLPVETYLKILNEEAVKTEGFSAYLTGETGLAKLFQSRYDDDKRFNKDDQPVVGVSWYAARAYSLWLSLLESNGRDTNCYRLPEEKEWEYAAAGKKGRLYPWGNPEPTPKLANYGSNEGATTPVGRYPEGATPEGLYDMAGNVWEWMENRYDKNTSARALRGGSWNGDPDLLRCSARNGYSPGLTSYVIGFRVVRSSHS